MSNLVNNPLVSVRILTYNHEKYIAQCIEGIVSQKTNFPFEIIIGEDCSTDATRQICRNYKEKYPDIINLIENERNLGVVANGERTIAAYRGKYIAWCDGDDYWIDDYKLQKQIDILERNPNIAVCFHPVKIIYEESNQKPIISNPQQKQISTIYDLAFGNFMHSPSVVFRHGLFDTNLDILKTIPARDYAVHLLNASKGDIFFINDVMAVYREHPKSAWTSKTLQDRHLGHINTLDMMTGLFNSQIDDIFTFVKATYYFDLFTKLKNYSYASEVKQYLFSALENTLKIPYFPNIDALNNKIIADLLKVIDQERDSKAFLLLSKLALQKHLYKDTIDFLENVLRIDPSNNEAKFLLAQSYFKIENYSNNIDVCNNLIEETFNREALTLLARAYWKSKQYEKSIQVAKRLLDFEPNNFDALKIIAFSYFEIGEKTASYEYCEKALSIFRYDVDLLSLKANLKKSMSGDTVFSPAKSINKEIQPKTQSTKDTIELVSIIIHTKNQAHLLERLINSIYVHNSKYNFEIIVSDNASTDETLNILKKFASQRINFRFVRNYNILPVAKAINNAIKNAYGNYFVVLNEVQSVSQNWLDVIIDNLKSTKSIVSLPKLFPNSSLVHSTGIKIEAKDEKLNFLYQNQNEEYETLATSVECVFSDALSANCLAFSSELIEKIGLFDESFHSFLFEIDFSLRAKEIGFPPICITDSVVIINERLEVNMPSEPEIALFAQKWGKLTKIENAIDIDNQDFPVEQSVNQRLLQVVQNLSEIGEIAEIQRLGNILLVPNLHSLSEQEILSLEIDEELFNSYCKISEQSSDFQFEDLFDISDTKPEPVNIIAESPETQAKPRILLTMYGWNESGGGTTFPRSVAIALARRGYEVAVFYATANHPTIQKPYYLEYRVEQGVHLYGVYNRPTVFLDALNPEREIRDERIVQLFAQVIDEFRPNIVHYNNFLGLSFAIGEIPFSKGIPSVFTTHNYHIIDPMLYLYRSDLSLWNNTDFFANSELARNYPDLHNSFRNRIQAAKKLVNEHITYTLAVSRRVKELFVDFGINPDKIAIVHQVPEQAQKLTSLNIRNRQPEHPLRFGYIGGVMPHKGAHVLVQAAQSIPKEKAEFLIYGFISQDYHRLLERLDVNHRIKFMGQYSTDDLPSIAEQLDAIVLPSVWEDCAPLVIAEAIAMKLPVIASRLGGFPDFVKHEINGKLYNHNSPSVLTKILWEVVENPGLISIWRSNCKLTHNFDDYLDHIIMTYEKLIAGNRPNVEEIELIF